MFARIATFEGGDGEELRRMNEERMADGTAGIPDGVTRVLVLQGDHRLFVTFFESRQAMEDAKTDIAWGHQIRSYVLDHSRIKDLRTNLEIGNTQAVLDGDLDPFIEASLKQGV